MAIPATSMMKARLGLNGMCHLWRQSSDGVDLDHVRENGALPVAVLAISIPTHPPARVPTPRPTLLDPNSMGSWAGCQSRLFIALQHPEFIIDN